jgi:hypothetical protein
MKKLKRVTLGNLNNSNLIAKKEADIGMLELVVIPTEYTNGTFLWK